MGTSGSISKAPTIIRRRGCARPITRPRPPQRRIWAASRSPAPITVGTVEEALRAIAERVVDKLKLKDQPAFQAAGDPVGLVLAAVAVEPVPDTYVVEVRVTHNVPEDAALWANTLSDVYMDYSLEGQVEAAKRAYAELKEVAAKERRLRTK